MCCVRQQNRNYCLDNILIAQAGYMPEPYNVDFDRNAASLGPYCESARSTIENGMCLTDSEYFSNADVKVLGDCISYILNDTVEG